MIKNILNLGDAALYCDFGHIVDKEINTKVIKYFKKLKEKQVDGITNLTPSYNKLIISFDINKINFKELQKIVEKINIDEIQNEAFRKIEIPVCCEEKFSLDIKRLESQFLIDRDKIFEIFFEKEYFCYMTGFIAGMPFLGDIDNKIRMKRLETPRVKVPKGSIGITEKFANVYTFESPGGWNIIGNTPLMIFDNKKISKPNLINPGDTVVFKKISIEDYKAYNE
tara:strand:- start:1935 stop:2609 length:675 start_codon:yes stop_codon:yes gene_type:complete